MAAQAATNHIGADIGRHNQKAGHQGEAQASALGPAPARQVGGQGLVGQVAQLDPMAGQKAQIKQAKNRGCDIGNRAGDRLQQQPATNHRP